MAASGERVEAESFSSERLGTSPKIRAGHDPVDIRNPHLPHTHRQVSADARGSDMELSHSQFSTCSSPPLLLPPTDALRLHGTGKSSTGAETLAESDTLTLDGASVKSGCEGEMPEPPPGRPLIRPLHSAPARMPDDSASLDPTDMPADGTIADDECVAPPDCVAPVFLQCTIVHW